MTKVVKLIDNEPPPLHIELAMRPDVVKESLFRTQEIGIENKSLLSRIDYIMRSTVRVTLNFNLCI